MNWFIVFVVLVVYGSRFVKAEIDDLLDSYKDAVEDLKKLEELSANLEHLQPSIINEKSPSSGKNSLSLLSNTKELKTKFKEVYDSGKKVFGKESKKSPEEKEKAKEKTKKNIDLVKGVGSGLVTVITGVKDKDWLKTVSGGLNMISSILAYAGPKGVLVGSILSLISAGLCAFGSKKAKSQTELIIEGINQAFQKFKDDEIRAATLYYLRGIQQAEIDIEAVLKSNHIKNSDLEKFINEKENLFLNQDQGGKILIDLEVSIKENCNKQDSCDRCLLKVQEFLILSMQRQMFALRIIGLYPKLLKEKNKPIYEIMYNASLRKVAEMRKMDKKWLDYFLKPMTSDVTKTCKTCCVSKYYSFPGEYSFIDAYVKMFANDLKVDDGGSYVIACRKVGLEGEIFQFKTNKHNYSFHEVSSEYDWVEKLKSIFVPPKYEVILYPKTGKAFIFKGPTVIDIKTKTYVSLTITKKEDLTGEYIRGCENPYMAGSCVQIDPKEKIGLVSMSDHFNPKSLYIPGGARVNIYAGHIIVATSSSFASANEIEYLYRNISGPLTMGYICEEKTYIKELFIDHTELPKDVIKICSKKDFGGWCDYIDQSVKNTKEIHSCVWEKIRSYDIPESMVLTVKARKSWTLSSKVRNFPGPKVELNNRDLENINIITVTKSPPDE